MQIARIATPNTDFDGLLLHFRKENSFAAHSAILAGERLTDR
jgi:hypothetical protein